MDTTNIISKIDFFDFMRCFFTDKAKYAKLTQNAKKPHFFMFRRMMSIMYPVQMNALSGLDDPRMMDALHKVFCTGTYPRWMYTSGKDEKSEKKELIHTKYSRDVLDRFMEVYDIEYKAVVELEDFNPTFLKAELDYLEEDLHPSINKTKQKKNGGPSKH